VSTVQLVEQHCISKSDPRFAVIDAAAFASKNLYNQATCCLAFVGMTNVRRQKTNLKQSASCFQDSTKPDHPQSDPLPDLERISQL